MGKYTKNSFEGGRSTDTDPSKIGVQQYLEAHNVELVGDGKYYALQNIRGTSFVKQFSVEANTETLGVFKNKYLISGSLHNCLTIFTGKASQKFKIWCYDIDTDTIYELYEENVGTDYITSDRVIDAVNYPENGVDIVYFTDFYHEVRYLKCIIPSPYTANFLTSYDLSLQRRGANGTIALTSVGSGGTLLSGTYQFCYRSADAVSKKFTKWSALTNPIHVYDKANGSTPVYSGIGLVTTRKITLSITPSTEETDNLDYLQLAVIENVGPTAPISASIIDIQSIPGTSLTYEYKSNSKIGSIPIEEITVDLAQIERVKTLNVKENRLFAGNIVYSDLEFDNGIPSITGGEILRQADSVADGFSSDQFASQYKGYWRGEVYRFGVIYTDKFGNKSSVQPLDLSSVTGNQISGGLTDMKFPDRSTSNLYTIFNTDGKIQSLGLRLTGLNNHPTWARSVEIVRVERKGKFKDIQFQSPIIPMSSVEGVGAIGNYPNKYLTPAGSSVTISDATPMTSDTVLIPKNLFWPEQRVITRATTAQGSGLSRREIGEAQLGTANASGYSYSMLFPSASMYNDSDPFVYTGAEKLDFVDFTLLKLSTYSDNPTDKTPPVINGDDVNTNIAGNFRALTDGQYFFHSTYVAKSISGTYKNIALTDYEFFQNLGQPDVVSGQSTMDYTSLQTGGIDIGFKPEVQKSSVVKLSAILSDIIFTGAVFNSGTLNPWTGGSYVVGSSGIKYETNRTNVYIPNYAGFLPDAFVSAIGIVNVKLGLGDDRYGSITDIQEYISTGSRHTFSAAEIATLEGGGDVSIDMDVWGGDCFVGPQLFKVCDSTYSVINQTKNFGSPETTSNLLSKWGKVFTNNDSASNSVLCIPVAVEGAAQYVQVIVESEYNGEVREPDTITSTASENSIPIYNNDSKASIRTPLTYKYNINLSKENSQKIYVPKPQFSFEQNEFGARIAYSDIKIYNSDQAGFDIFRVANTYDLEEKYYPITKLSLAGDDLYAIQEQGVSYIPTGERQIEQTDGGNLAVRSGDVIGRPILIDSERGSQHLRGIVETGGVIFIPDNKNKSVYVLAGKELKPITKDNESVFRTMFDTQFDGKNILGVFDPIKREYWLISNASPYNCQVYSEILGNWVCNYEFKSSAKLFGGVYTKQKQYLIGYNAGATNIYTMYTGNVNQLFGEIVVPRVDFSLNPDSGISKVFDDNMINATQRLSSMDFEVVRESEVGNQTTTVSLDIPQVEGNYRVKVLRDSAGARLRGMYCIATIKWKDVQSAIKEVFTAYRHSSRSPF